MSEWIKKIVQYITKDIWVKKEHEYKSRHTRWAVQQFKVFIFTAQGIGQHRHSGPLGRADFLYADVARTDRGPGLQRHERFRIRGPTERVPARAVPAVQGPDRSGADIRQRDDPADQRRRDRVGRRGRAVLVGHQGIQLRRKLVQQHLGSATLALADAQVQRLHDGHRHRADSVGHLEQHRHPDTAAPAPLHLDPDRQRPCSVRCRRSSSGRCSRSSTWSCPIRK